MTVGGTTKDVNWEDTAIVGSNYGEIQRQTEHGMFDDGTHQENLHG